MFARAVKLCLKSEGVFSDDPRDNGGITKYGITKAAMAQYTGRRIDDIGDDEIRNLTVDGAKDIYRAVFWRSMRCAELPWVFALPLFDVAVNKGVVTTIRIWQRALRVTPDGDFGNATMTASRIAASTKAGIADILSRFYADRIFMDTKSEDFDTFGRGWIARQFRKSWEAMDGS